MHSLAMVAIQQYVIVRELPGIGSSTQEQLAGASDTSNKAIAQASAMTFTKAAVWHACRTADGLTFVR